MKGKGKDAKTKEHEQRARFAPLIFLPQDTSSPSLFPPLHVPLHTPFSPVQLRFRRNTSSSSSYPPTHLTILESIVPRSEFTSNQPSNQAINQCQFPSCSEEEEEEEEEEDVLVAEGMPALEKGEQTNGKDLGLLFAYGLEREGEGKGRGREGKGRGTEGEGKKRNENTVSTLNF